MIPKANGGEWPLGIPGVRDRVVQTAAKLVLEPIFEADFLDDSHGFRPRCSALDALDVIERAVDRGSTAVYDADLKGYFDSIPHDELMACVEYRIADGAVLKLIRQWLRAPIMEEPKDRHQPPRKVYPRNGTPQGGVISALLASLYCTGRTSGSTAGMDRHALPGPNSCAMPMTSSSWPAIRAGESPSVSKPPWKTGWAW
jgi:RNA-directed DNA polymerase